MQITNSLKKYKTGYSYYSKEKRQVIKEIDSNIDRRKVTSIISELWYKLSDEQKEKYQLLEIEDKNKFIHKKREKKKETKKGQNITKEPKKERKPYMFFVSENKENLKGLSKFKNKSKIKILSEKWKCMSDDEKMPYVQKALLDKERFIQEWEEYITSYMKSRTTKLKDLSKKEKYDNLFEDIIKASGNYIIDDSLRELWNLEHFETIPINNQYKGNFGRRSFKSKPMVFTLEKTTKKSKNTKLDIDKTKVIELKQYQKDEYGKENDDMNDEVEEEENNSDDQSEDAINKLNSDDDEEDESEELSNDFVEYESN